MHGLSDLDALMATTGAAGSAIGDHPVPAGTCAELRERAFDLAVRSHGGGRFSSRFLRPATWSRPSRWTT
ncbi:hypothetical protein ACIBIZ_33170 [Nonomuraea spiralis]|uniref:hypothetical protein n=1 Tax=Nonomuraea spiralis TaxID=46182 RepID=UPI0037BB3631